MIVQGSNVILLNNKDDSQTYNMIHFNSSIDKMGEEEWSTSKLM